MWSNNLFWASLLIVFCLKICSSFVIAPPWVNPAINPCSSHSWQLIEWPADKQCYRIFEQGPCPHSQELAFNSVTGLAECRCPKNLLFWAATNRCYAEYSRGPCEVNQYLERISESEVRCADTKICDNGWMFWPPDQECFQLYTQGPCHKGDLLIMNPLTTEPYCGCDPLLLNQYYFPALKLCYEHYTRGPCESGLLYAYNHTSQVTHCMCDEDLVHFHEQTNQCFQFGQKGPCQKGQIFEFRESAGRGDCRCREGYVSWPDNGECYKAYTLGPCRPGEIIVPEDGEVSGGGAGICVRNPCPRAHLYFPEPGRIPGKRHRLEGLGGSCHKVGSRGPCPLGELVVFEKYSGKSFRGECGCSPGYNQNYWSETGQCYEWYTRGPCPESFLFEYNKDTGHTECVCDDQEGFVFWNETKQCYRVYTKGPCPDNAWLIPTADLTEVFCECKSGYYFSPSRYTCEPSPAIETKKSSLHPYPSKSRGGNKQTPSWSELKEKYDVAGRDREDENDDDNSNEDEEEDAIDENSTEPVTKTLDLFQGVFVNPRHRERLNIGRRRNDSGEDDISAVGEVDWLPGRNQWEWWRRLQGQRNYSN